IPNREKLGGFGMKTMVAGSMMVRAKGKMGREKEERVGMLVCVDVGYGGKGDQVRHEETEGGWEGSGSIEGDVEERCSEEEVETLSKIMKLLSVRGEREVVMSVDKLYIEGAAEIQGDLVVGGKIKANSIQVNEITVGGETLSNNRTSGSFI